MKLPVLNLKILFFIVLTFFSLELFAQTKQDSTIKSQVKDTTKIIHSPSKAAKLSAIFPGLGQAYNKKYWKIPVVYASFATIGYFIGLNNRNYNLNVKAYNELKNWKSGTYDISLMPNLQKIKGIEYYNLNDATSRNNILNGLIKQQDQFRRWRDLNVIFMFAAYGLNIIDASVDAHFYDFDMSDDLSFNWHPSISNHNNHLVYSFNCSFSF